VARYAVRAGSGTRRKLKRARKQPGGAGTGKLPPYFEARNLPSSTRERFCHACIRLRATPAATRVFQRVAAARLVEVPAAKVRAASREKPLERGEESRV